MIARHGHDGVKDRVPHAAAQSSDQVALQAPTESVTCVGVKPCSAHWWSQPTELLPGREGSGPPGRPSPDTPSSESRPSLSWMNWYAAGRRAERSSRLVSRTLMPYFHS